MGRIFYWQKDGTIYGTYPGPHEHLKTPDGRPKIELPEGVTWMDVPEASYAIPWPSRDGKPGCKEWSRVVGDGLVLRDDLAPILPDPDEALAKTIQAATTLDELKAALLGATGKARAKGRLV